jgi:2-polyprenyl-3-methyl-5-hydroxy-6-metoxy-1,4-benzoquinol methylase
VAINKNDLSQFSARQFAHIARALYRGAPLLLREIQCWRPYICPFEKLIPYISNEAYVLDIGCGAGLLLGLAAGAGLEFRGRGLDVSMRAIAAAKAMVRRAEVLNPKVALAFDLIPKTAIWPDGNFDVVFLVDVLHHVKARTQREFFARAISRVRPGGVLVYKDMCLRPWWKAEMNRLHDLVLAREFINYVPIQQVARWAVELQMNIIVQEGFTRYWYGHELLVFRGKNEPSNERPTALDN